jgi:ABC-type glycerol-3-phosphate transport system permease component
MIKSKQVSQPVDVAAMNSARMQKLWRALSQSVQHIVLIVLLFLSLFPLIFMVYTSFKTQQQFRLNFWFPTWPLRLENYTLAWNFINGYLFNTVMVTVAIVAGVLLFGSLSAYAFARHRFPGRDLFFYAIISLMMIPGILTLVPAFVLVKDLGLLNTRTVLILPAIASGQVFAIFILTTFLRAQPEELFEAARIDGAGDFQCYRHIALPLSVDVMATLAIVNIIASWNSFIWPLITVNDNALKVISIGLYHFSRSTVMNPHYGFIFAGYVIATIPLLLLFSLAGRYYVRGITSGALKF